MISVAHLTGDDVAARAEAALSALAACPGYLRGTLGRSADDPSAWLLLTEWQNVGSYRRALGNYRVKLDAMPLLADALNLPGAFEPLLEIGTDGTLVTHRSDHA
jgi:hypothetical protein